jgi:hypothetical protein
VTSLPPPTEPLVKGDGKVTLPWYNYLKAQNSEIFNAATASSQFLSVYDFGAVYDGSTDDTGAIEATFAYAVANGITQVYLGSGTAVLTSQITIPANLSLFYGDLTWDFSSGSAVDFPDDGCVLCDGGALTQISELSADADSGDNELTFVSGPSLESDDIIVIYNPTDFSYSPFRSYYRAGEYCKVQSVSGTTVNLFGGLYADYLAADVDVYYMGNNTLTMTGGRFKVIGNTAVNYGFFLRRLRDVCMENVAAVGSQGSGIAILGCYGIVGSGILAEQDLNSGLGTDYGVVIGNSQAVRLTGQFYARRHAIAVGNSGTYTSSIHPVNRDMLFEGTFLNDYIAASLTVGAADHHGNSEFITYRGMATGLTLRGNKCKFQGILKAIGPDRPLVSLDEMSGCDFEIDAYFDAPNSNPYAGGIATSGIINCGAVGVTQGPQLETEHGGVIKIKGVMDAPDAERLLLFKNRGYVGAEPIAIDVSGLIVKSCNVTANPAFFVSSIAGNDWDLLDRRGFYSLATTAAWSVANTTYDTGTGFSTLVLQSTSPQLKLTDTDTGADCFIDGSSGTGSIAIHADANNEVANSRIACFVDGTERFRIDPSSVSPNTSDATALGTSTLQFSDLFLASGAVINFNAGDVTMTHVAASGSIVINADVDNNAAGSVISLGVDGNGVALLSGTALYPGADDGAALGITDTNEWSDLFLAEGGAISWDNGDVTLTQTGSSLTVAGGVLAVARGALTIASGVITANSSFHTIDTEASAASDDLDTINGGVDGAVLYVRALNSARTVVLKDGTGNIQGPGDVTLDNNQDIAHLIYDSAHAAWLVVSVSNNGA